IWAGTSGLGIAIGPIAGGLLLSRFWWGSVFLVNVPIVVAAFVGAVVLVPDSRNPDADPPDPVGAILSIAGLGMLLWAIIQAPNEGWTSPAVVGVGMVSLAILAGFVAWEAHSRHPMLKLWFFSNRSFSAAAAAECLGLFGLMGALFVQTQFLQFDLGYSPLQAGLRILPIAAVLGVSAPLAPVVARFIGVKATAAVGLVAIAGGLVQIAASSTAGVTYANLVPGMLLLGLGTGLLMPTTTNSVVGSVPQGDSGIGSATNGVAIQVGGALGVAVVGSVMLTRYQDHMAVALAGRHIPVGVAHTILGSLGGALAVAGAVGGTTGVLLAGAARTAFLSGCKLSMAVSAAVAAAGVGLVLLALPSRPSRPEGRRGAGSPYDGGLEPSPPTPAVGVPEAHRGVRIRSHRSR
ncbi:MAG: MFS transporter, partial [Acidimicrobiales bacterium]